LFPPSLDELVPQDHPVRVIEAFVASLKLVELGFTHAEAEAMGRPSYDPADLLKLYLYGYLNRVRSSRRLERECQRNIEVMWLLGRLAPDHKTIAEFRRCNGQAFIGVCRGFVRFCREVGLLGAELVAVDGSKFQAASSRRRVLRKQHLTEEARELDRRIQQYLNSLDAADRDEQVEPIDRSAVRAALAQLRERQADCQSALEVLDELGGHHGVGEGEARLMRTGGGHQVAYNVQTAVDAQHGLIVHHEVTNAGNDTNQLEPTAKAAQEALGGGALKVVADAGYSSAAQFVACEEAAITPYVPLNRAPLRSGPRFYGVDQFSYEAEADRYHCPAGKVLALKQIQRTQLGRIYAARAEDCSICRLKHRCTGAERRFIQRHWHESAFERMTKRLADAPSIMRQRRSLAEHPFAQLKLGVFGDGRFLLRGLRGARTEMAIAVVVRNLKRVMNILGNRRLIQHLARA
jgi:transposase